MKQLVCIAGWLILSSAIFSQPPMVRFYLDDGSVREYNLEDIEQIVHINRTNDMIMEIFQQDVMEVVYPVMSVSRLSFTADSLDTRMLTAHIFDQPRHFSLHTIDSIVFSRLEPKVIDNITVVDSLLWADIVTVEEHSITIRAGSSLASFITIGWYMVSAPTPEAPYGFLRKVTGLNTQGNLVIATTENGDLFEVIEDGVISFEVAFTEKDLNKLYIDPFKSRDHEKYGPEKSIELTFSHSFAEGLGEFSTTMNFEPKLAFNLVMKRFIVRQLFCQLECALTLEPKISIKDELEYKKRQTVGPKYPMPNTPAFVGPVPIVFTGYVDFLLGLDAKIMKNISLKNQFGMKMTVGMEYNRGRTTERWRNLSTYPELIWEPWPKELELSVGGSVKLSIGPRMNMSTYNLHDVFSYYFWTAGFVELEVDFTKSAWWKVDGGVEISGGINSKIKSLKYDLPVSASAKTTIIQAASLISGIKPSEGIVGDTILITGSRFGKEQEMNYVGFKFGESVLPIDIIRATDYVKWNDTSIQLIVPHGIPTPPGLGAIDVDVMVNTRKFWNNMVLFKLLVGPVIDSFSPDTVRIGRQVVIQGKRFGETRNTSEVYFGDVAATEYIEWCDTLITAKAPAEIDDGDLVVVVDDIRSNGLPYAVAVPVIASIYPNEVFPGDEMVITGKYFDQTQNESIVSFGGVLASSYISWNDTQIVLKVPDKIESGLLWVEVAGKKSNEVTYVLKEVEVTIMPPRIVTYEMLMGATEVKHDFEAYAKPDSVYRFTWKFDDGNTFSEVVQKGETSKASNQYVDLKDGDVFYPSVELYDLDGRLLAIDDMTIHITFGSEEITVGSLVWMTKNLDVAVGNNQWPQDRYCESFWESGRCHKFYMKEHKEYGRFYDWESAFAACESIGWRLPSVAEWRQLVDHWGGEKVASGKLRSTRTGSFLQSGNYTYKNPNGHPFWYEPNTDATNESGFSALPGGYYADEGLFGISPFQRLGTTGRWLSYIEDDSGRRPYLISITPGYNVAPFSSDKGLQASSSVRCVRDVD